MKIEKKIFRIVCLIYYWRRKADKVMSEGSLKESPMQMTERLAERDTLLGCANRLERILFGDIKGDEQLGDQR